MLRMFLSEAGFDLLAQDGRAVAANGVAFIASARAAVVGIVDQRIARAAATAFDQTRKQIIRPQPSRLHPGRVHIDADRALAPIDVCHSASGMMRSLGTSSMT